MINRRDALIFNICPYLILNSQTNKIIPQNRTSGYQPLRDTHTHTETDTKSRMQIKIIATNKYREIHRV